MKILHNRIDNKMHIIKVTNPRQVITPELHSNFQKMLISLQELCQHLPSFIYSLRSVAILLDLFFTHDEEKVGLQASLENILDHEVKVHRIYNLLLLYINQRENGLCRRGAKGQ
jgi:hypothetical protein